MARTQAKDYDNKRSAILKAAAVIFGREGFERTSMIKVAEACGVSKALLYHYYANKEALLFALIESHLLELVHVVDAKFSCDVSALERLNSMVGALLAAYKDADNAHRVQINSMNSLPQAKQLHLKELERKFVKMFSIALKENVPTLEGKPELLMPVTMSLFGMLNWHYMWFRPDGPISRENYAEIATKLILEGARGL